MCGINGFTRQTKERLGCIEKMNAATRHRGPDGVGTWSDEYVTLGQNLLAITETPAKAKQPYVSPDGNFVLVYNGEVYNYTSLKRELEQQGERFTTSGDTEVIFRGLIKYGPTFCAKLDGMFAIALYDKKARKLLLARDYSGMKPLYYARDGDALVFSSEIRGLLAYGFRPLLHLDAAKLFFLFGYTPTEETLIQGIKKLPPGSALLIDVKSGNADRISFGWEERSEANADQSGAALRAKIKKAVIEHTMGLRPFGLFLSGGLDSTVILHELAERERGVVKTYTTRFETSDPRFNEDADLAARLAKEYHIDHHELLVTERAFIEHYEDAIRAMEEPRYNPSVPAYWLLAQLAARDITIVLTGGGGDELFLGYPRYIDAMNIGAKYSLYPAFLLDLVFTLRAYREGLVRRGRLLRLKRPLERWAYVNKITPPAGNPAFRFMDDFDLVEAVRVLLGADIPPLREMLTDEVNAIAELDRWFWLANEEFMRTDKIIMHFGMEGRFPFLARDIVRWANVVPSSAKLSGGTKSLLRDAYKDRLPEYIVAKRKTGWNAPFTEWMGGAFGAMVNETLSDAYYPPTSALFDFSALKRSAISNKIQFTKSDMMKFLPVFQFQIWARAFQITL